MSFSPYIVTSEVPSTRSFIFMEDDSLYHSVMELAYQKKPSLSAKLV